MPITGAEAATTRRATQAIWAVPPNIDPIALLADLEREFTLVPEAKEQQPPHTWYDSFDWRLYAKGVLLCQSGSDWLLHDMDANLVHRQAGKPGPKFFAADLPPGLLRETLGPLLAMRCLLPLFTETRIEARYAVKNKDVKTVALLAVTEHQCTGTGAPFRSVCLERVRGYDKAYRAVRSFLVNYGLGRESGPTAFFSAGVAGVGRRPLDYSSGFAAQLEPGMTTRAAMTAIYRQLLESMQTNEPGIIEDLDSEFLHDFRVALRRTRSGLAQVKEALPPAVTADFKRRFSWLGSVTGETRDLDVYLLSVDKYRAMLPARLHGGLAPFFSEIADRRAAAYRKLVRQLRSKKYREVLADWNACLAEDGTGEAEEGAGPPIGELAGRIILRKFRKVLKDGRAIGPASPDQELHSLRIQCKKLRYVLEFFDSLYPGDEVAQAIRQLKRLQDNLGSFNDLSVQQEMLEGFLTGVRPGSRRNQEMAASLGGLLASLHQEHRRVRRNFAKRFREFSRPENRELYGRLFGRQESPAT